MSKHADLEELCINTIRFLAVDAVQKAESGHPGMPMGAAPMAYALWTRFMKYNPANPDWFDRDRFILSAGHGSMLLYAMLHLTGYDLSLEDLKNFRQWGSITPGHPERVHTPGVEVTTGPLGQGFANGVGMAIAESHLAERFNRPGHEIIHHHTYGIVSDGDIMEGVAAEAASLAGHLRLGKLIYLYDANHITLSAATDLTLTENVAARFDAYGWHTQTVDDGNDVAAIAAAVDHAREEAERPSLIVVRTHIGYGSPNKQDTFEAHGSPLGAEEVKKTKRNLGWPLEPSFYIPEEVETCFLEARRRGKVEEDAWKTRFEKYRDKYPKFAAELEAIIAGDLPEGWATDRPVFEAKDGKMATRKASETALNAFGAKVPALVGGSADLNPSTHSVLKGAGNFESPDGVREGDRQGEVDGGWNYGARNFHFGVREHAMGSVANGIAAHGGLLPYTATFLIFSDYMRPTIRLAALMKLPVKFIFTHDSIGLGEDGPTHQPIEQVASLRAIPDLVVLRPADANETSVAWEIAIESKDRPVALVFSRQKLPVLDQAKYASADNVRKGAYVLSDSKGTPDLILIATGSEVALALEAQVELTGQNVNVRVVSMPSWELFEAQDEKYRESVLPPEVTARLAIEAGSPLGWHRWVGDRGGIIAVDRFGASAPGGRVMEEYGFSVHNVIERATKLLRERATA